MDVFYSLIAQESESEIDFGILTRFLFDIAASVVDIMAFLLPRTPQDLTIGSLLNGYLQAQSESWAVYFIVQIFSGLVGILVIAGLYKLIKILPFT